MKRQKVFWYVVLSIFLLLGPSGPAWAAPVSGAIFTTTVNGDVVNGNVEYKFKEDVYLDGGPGPNAPSTAAGLPEGDYYFQVTDPSGKDLLSTDHISCRRVHVNEHGVIDTVYSGSTLVKEKGKWAITDCKHNEGVDQDHYELGAITVQLFPYDDTPNPGGVYKAWMTPVENYAGDTNINNLLYEKNPNINGENWQPGNVHGFIPRWSKTDNYKVKEKGKPVPPPEITVLKFHDENYNAVWDQGENEITGWAVDVTDPANNENTVYTPAMIIAAPSGYYTLVEETPAGSQQTVSILDDAILSSFPYADPTVMVNVLGESGETHVVIYGNVGVGSIKACKIFDRDGDGYADPYEPGISGWKMKLSGDLLDYPITLETDGSGCVTFGGLLPGVYTVTELVPAAGGWIATGDTSKDLTVVSSLNGSTLAGTNHTHSFTNICTATADFGTKGFWHNKNGLALITQADIDYVNGLPPYSSPSTYFDAGDEPFDGQFTDGTPVAAANGILGEVLAPEGSTLSEISQFLVDSNAGGDPREQLAQQLLAFIFNARHALGSVDTALEISPGNFVTAKSLIDQAIALWQYGSDEQRNQIKTVLDNLNNNDAVAFIPYEPCDVDYTPLY